MRQDAEIIDVRKMKIVQPVLEIAMKIFQEIMTMTIMIQLIQKIVYAMMEILQIATIDGMKLILVLMNYATAEEIMIVMVWLMKGVSALKIRYADLLMGLMN